MRKSLVSSYEQPQLLLTNPHYLTARGYGHLQALGFSISYRFSSLNSLKQYLFLRASFSKSHCLFILCYKAGKNLPNTVISVYPRLRYGNVQGQNPSAIEPPNLHSHQSTTMAKTALSQKPDTHAISQDERVSTSALNQTLNPEQLTARR